MTLREIAHILDAEVLTGADKLDMERIQTQDFRCVR